MNHKIIIIGILMFLLGSATTALYLTGVQSNASNLSLKTNRSMVTERSDHIDRHFIEQMIPHHEDAISMAKLANTRAKTPEIKALARDIIDSQGHEISQMKVWYKQWFGVAVPVDIEIAGGQWMGRGRMHMGMMGDEHDIATLKNADDFDREFIREMIPHHQMAIMMAQMLYRSTEREEMKTLAQNIIKAQTKEINEMRTWYASWYQ